MFKQLHINITLADALILIPKYQKMLKALLSNKEKLLELANTPLNENRSAVILKKLHEKLGDPGKFLIPCDFSELKCKALADLADFVIVDYQSDPKVPLIFGKPFLRTARALIDVHEEEMILQSINLINVLDDSCKEFLEDLFATNHQSGNPTFSSHPNLTSPKVKDDIFKPKRDNVLIEKFINLDSNKDLPPPHNINPLSGSTISSSPNHLLEEFTDELALITLQLGNDDLPFDIESDLKEIEYLLNHDHIKEMDSILEDLVDEHNLADLNDNLGEKIKESKLLIDELDLPSNFLPSPEYDSFLFEDFSKVDALPLTNNEDKVFNPGILIQENLFEVITRVAPDKNVKKLATSHASLILKDFDPPLYELPFFKEVIGSKTLLSFSFENEEKVFKPEILTSKGVYSSLISKLSHQGYKVSKSLKFLKARWRFFLSHKEDIHILDVPCLHFHPS
nr:reverse transcriptase domain-containing protein [Tanacetum cinerariifolium]